MSPESIVALFVVILKSSTGFMHMIWWLSTRNSLADLRIVATQREPCGHTLYHFSLSQNRVPSCGLCRCSKWRRNQGVQGQPFSHCQILLVMYTLPLQYILVSGCQLLQWCSHEVFHFKSCWENVLGKCCTCQRWCEEIAVEIEHSISDLDHGRVGSWVHRNRAFEYCGPDIRFASDSPFWDVH